MRVDKKQVVDIIFAEYGVRSRKVKDLGGGSFGRAFKVALDKKTIVVKVCSLDGMCAKEAAELKILREYCPVKIPEVYFVRLKSDGSPIDCYGMEFIEGHNAFTDFTFLFATRKQKRLFADSVADALIKLHSHTSSKFGDITNPIYDSWQEFYFPHAKKIMQGAEKLYAEGRLKKYIYETAREMFSRYEFIFSDMVAEACLIHGDMNVMNIMVKKPLRLVGFIDPLDSMYADREYELFQLFNLTGKAFKLYDAYKNKYPVSAKCDLKCAFYSLFQELNCYLRNGTYAGFIMRAAVKNAKKQMKQLNERQQNRNGK